MADFDWSRFTVRINVKASIEKLYWCWAKEGIEYWFAKYVECIMCLTDATDFHRKYICAHTCNQGGK